MKFVDLYKLVGEKRHCPASGCVFDAKRGLPLYDLTPQEVIDVKLSKAAITKDMVIGSKEIIAEGFNWFYRTHYSSRIEPNNIYVTKRTSEAVIVSLWHMVEKIKESGQTPKALLMAPAYLLFERVLEELGVEIVHTKSLTGKVRNYDRQRVLSEGFAQNPDANILVVNSPSNPLGQVYSKEIFQEIITEMHAREHMYVLSDIVYDRLSNPNNRMFSLFQLAADSLRERIIEVSGNSKTFATGDRKAIGWMISSASVIDELRASPELKKIDPKVTTRHDALRATVNVIQDKDYWKDVWDSYRSRMRSITNILRGAVNATADIKFGESGYYLTIDFTKSHLDVELLCQKLQEKGIELPHGKGYGGEKVIRICAGSVLTSRAYADAQGLDFVDRGEGEFYFPDEFVACSDLGLYRILALELKLTIQEMQSQSFSKGTRTELIR